MSWVSQDESRVPLDKMFQQIQSSITGGPDGRRKNSSDKNSSRELRRNKQSEVQFLANLVVKSTRSILFPWSGGISRGNYRWRSGRQR